MPVNKEHTNEKIIDKKREKRELTAKQLDFVRYYADSGSQSYNNAYQSAIKAGYTTNTAKAKSGLWLEEVRIKQAIFDYKAPIAEKLDHNRDIAIKLLTSDLNRLNAKADAGDVQAIQARTRIIAELNSISNLHSSTVHNEGDGLKLNFTVQEPKANTIKIKDIA